MLCNVFASVHTWIQSDTCRRRYFGVGIYDRLRSAGDWREDFAGQTNVADEGRGEGVESTVE